MWGYFSMFQLNSILAIFIGLVGFHPARLLSDQNTKNTEAKSEIIYPGPNPVSYIYVHGLHGKGNHGFKWSIKSDKNKYILFDPILHFDFPDVDGRLDFNPLKSDLAQEGEVAHLYKHFKTFSSEKNKKLVISGVSRGASTIINFAGLHANELENVSMFILESPFDVAIEVMRNVARMLMQDKHPFINFGINYSISKFFPKHKPDGMSPIKMIAKIPKDIPLLLIHSRKDLLISVNASRKLYIELKKAGHQHVYYLETENGSHARVLWGPQGDIYMCVVHALYKKYNLPHDLGLAAKGADYLHLCTPTVEHISSLIRG